MQSGKWLAELEKPILIIQEGLAKACFATGTKLWTPQGYRAIEEIRAGDSVFSRDEWNPAAPVEAKVVEEVFQRFAGVLDLRVAGQSIRTTGEHPFYAAGLGWTPANELQSGMELLTASGEWVRVDGVDDTGEWEVVYNLRVANHHTYFVGDQDWGWAAWAHNSCTQDYYIYNDWEKGGLSVFKKNGDGKAVSVKLADGSVESFNDKNEALLLRKVKKHSAIFNADRVDQDPLLKLDNITSVPMGEKFKDWLDKASSPAKADQLGNTYTRIANAPTNAPKAHAHHIVLKLGKDAIKPGETPISVRCYAQKTQKILQGVGIDSIFGYDNLVWAPNWGGHGDITSSNAPLDTQAKSYAKSVFDRLSAVAQTKTAIIAELKKIATQFIQGIW